MILIVLRSWLRIREKVTAYNSVLRVEYIQLPFTYKYVDTFCIYVLLFISKAMLLREQILSRQTCYEQ